MIRSYTIKGLDCAEEIEALRRTVGRLPGVADLDFNLLNATMRVESPDDQPEEADIFSAVRSAGLEAVPVDAFCPAGVCAVEENYWEKNGRAVLCWSSGVLTLAGYLSHAFIHGGFIHAFAGGGEAAVHQTPPLSIIFYLLAVVTGGWFILPKALSAARRFRPDMNLLMTIAVLGALVISQWMEAAAVTFLFTLSLLLESWSVGRARRAIRTLLDITPPTARCRDEEDGSIREKPVAEILPGITVLVRPGERIPLDGEVIEGRTAVNQAPITGESMPVEKGPGDEIFAGTINETGAIEFRVTRPASDTTLARIIRMVEEAQSRRAPSEQWVEKFARYYTPLMVVLAALIALIPPLLFGGGWGAWFYEALVILVIACPCALVISTPVSIVAALTSAARAGVLIKGGAFLEAAARVRVAALDKTGTVTAGRPEVQRIVPLSEHSETELLERAGALERLSEHPLAGAILRYAAAKGVAIPEARDFRVIKGKGAEATVQGRLFWLGSHRLVHEKGMEDAVAHQLAREMEEAGHTVIAIGNDWHLCGLISVADTVRPEARAAVKALKREGIERVVMLTGDNFGTAKAVAGLAGIDEIRAELLPEDKLKAVEDLVAGAGPTVMVGDGINDAPALAAATLGIAMGGAGTDAAIETADIALISDDLMKVPWLIGHGRRTLRIIRQNIGFALAVKVVFMALALAEMATLWMAIAADTGASLLVVFNALRLLKGKVKEER